MSFADFKMLVWEIRVKYRIMRRENKSYKWGENTKRSRLESEMLVYAHALEKGMGIPKPRRGYGKEKAEKVALLMSEYKLTGYDTTRFPYMEALAILKAYCKLMESQGVKINEKILEHVEESLCVEYKAGAEVYSKKELLVGLDVDVEKLFKSRHSMRAYSKEEISDKDIEAVLELANTAPSACNRQATKVYYTATQEKARELEALIAGSRSFEGETPYFMLVTTDRAYFAADEYLQWYTNGGIFLSFLVLALHAKGIGSIIMQWKIANDNEEQVRKLVGIPQNEALIAVIGYGKYPDADTKCIAAYRKPIREIINKF